MHAPANQRANTQSDTYRFTKANASANQRADSAAYAFTTANARADICAVPVADNHTKPHSDGHARADGRVPCHVLWRDV